MPLTEFQTSLAQHLAANRSEDSYLAGGAAIHFEPNSKRYSNDLDYFHDSEERVASAFADDRSTLENLGYTIKVEITQPGYIRAQVKFNDNSTKVEWAHDSAWRFMPPVKNEVSGYQLHPVDLAINKVLALVGRDEARDFVDILHQHQNVLSLGALCWAACGKDPGFTPLSILEMLRRRGKYRQEDFDRLMLTEKVSPVALKEEWLQALEQAEAFIKSRLPSEIGCLYYSPQEDKFVEPAINDPNDRIIPHFGAPGGVIPRVG